MFDTVRQGSVTRPADFTPQAASGAELVRPVATVRKTIAFVAPQDRIPECLLAAVEREFPAYQVRLIENIGEIEAALSQSVALYLLDGAMVSDFRAYWSARRSDDGNVATAVLFDDMADAQACYAELCQSTFLSGVLPMNLRLDTWLAALALILRGGEFIPTALIRGRQQGHRSTAGNGAFSSDPSTLSGPAHGSAVDAGNPDHVEPNRMRSAASAAELGELTEREFQVLEQVARGTSNKVIAGRFGLSEHTIKIHLHNIIRKLRVTNRTEAAAIFIQARING